MDLGKIKRDVLSEIERDRKFAQADLERVVADGTMSYQSKISRLKSIIQKLVESDALANATNNIFVDVKQEQPQGEQKESQSEPQSVESEQPQPQNVVEGLNQSHSE